MASKVVHAYYLDDEVLMDAVKALQIKHYHIEEVYTPFPVHGLDKLMGLPHTRLAICSFLYGLVGLTVAVTMMNFIMISDWPQNIGGKPSFSFLENMPAFVPIMFELTVFFAAHLMVITFYMRSKLWPFKNFLVEVDANDTNIDTLTAFLKDTGAVEINLKDKAH